MNYRNKRLTIWISLTIVTVVCATRFSRKSYPTTVLPESYHNTFPYFFLEYDLAKGSKKFTQLDFQCFGHQDNFFCNPVGETTKTASGLVNFYHKVYSKVDPRIDEKSYNKISNIITRYKRSLARHVKDSPYTSTFYPSIQMLYSSSKDKIKPHSKVVYDFIVKKDTSSVIKGHSFEFLGFEFPVTKKAELNIRRTELDIPRGIDYVEELIDDESLSYKRLSRLEKKARQVVFYNKYGNLIMHDNRIKKNEFLGFQLSIKIPYIINPETEIFIHNLISQKLQLSPATGKIEFLKNTYNEFSSSYNDGTKQEKSKPFSLTRKLFQWVKTLILARVFSYYKKFRFAKKIVKKIL